MGLALHTTAFPTSPILQQIQHSHFFNLFKEGFMLVAGAGGAQGRDVSGEDCSVLPVHAA